MEKDFPPHPGPLPRSGGEGGRVAKNGLCQAYLAGIDEAGYGPNLGPMTQAAIVWGTPDGNADLWEHHSKMLSREADRTDRIPVADSKALYGPAKSIAALERGLFALLPALASPPFTLDSFLDQVKAVGLAELRAEPWYDPAMTIPVDYPLEKIATDVQRWQEHLNSSSPMSAISTQGTFVCVTPTPWFNRIISEQGTKGAATSGGVIELLRLIQSQTAGTGKDTVVAVDKLGGRNYYGAVLQSAFPDIWLQTIREGAKECVYRTQFPDREDPEMNEPSNFEIRFQPKAEERYLPVALASMLAKYLRELLMVQFNAYWKRKVPAILPTAGYPNDAKRFLEEIRTTMAAEGILMENVWRTK